MLRISKYILTLSLIIALISAIGVSTVYFLLAPQLPSIEQLKETQLQVPLRIFSAENELIAEFGEKRRIPVEFNQLPTELIQAFLASEDDRFYEHHGVDYQGILRAVFSLLTTGKKAQGGSTITMQVARNFYLSNEKTYLRKLNEIILAFQIENSLTKNEILTLYLNKIYLGNRAYGVGAAADVYYGKPLQELSLAEYAMIAGLPKAPSRYNPVINPDRAMQRRNYVLHRMWEVGYISEETYRDEAAKANSAEYHSRDVEVYAPFVAEMVRNELINQYGEEAYNLGLNVYTTIRGVHQNAANSALQTALIDYDKRHGYRGAIEHYELAENSTEEELQNLSQQLEAIGPLQPAIVIAISQDEADLFVKDHGVSKLDLPSLSWAGKYISTNRKTSAPKSVSDLFSLGDVVYVYQDVDLQWQLAQLPEAQGALIAISPYDGAVTALNGGFDYFHNKFNRVTQSKRQPGSGFKPFIYSAALEKGYTAASIINDAPVVFDDVGLENVWRPENYSGKFFGPTRLREALTHSRNLVSIRLLRDIGADFTIDYASRFGFDTSQMPHNLSLALGSGSAAPWDMARAYSALANGGYRIEPYLIHHIEDASGSIIYQAQPETVCETCLDIAQQTLAIENDADAETTDSFKAAKRIMTPQNAYIMNSLLRDVVKFGTGRKALTLGRQDLAGKTGTTNDQVDAWFNGFHPELVATAWVGFDSPRTLGRYETGGRAALPMWIDFMREALKDIPEEPLKMPVDMVTVRIDPKTGLLARADTADAIYETFRNEFAPTELTPSEQGQTPIELQSETTIDLF
jgi:penicillin-binding protein 1A